MAATTPPPQRADRLLRWFCREELQEEILGDLHEFWTSDEVKALSHRRALWAYWFHVLHFLRPFAFKRKRQNSNSLMLYRNYIKLGWRQVNSHRGSAALKVLSLSLGIACFLFIFLYLRGELTYDQFHQDADRIHRVVVDFVDREGNRTPDATTTPALTYALRDELPELETAINLFPSWGFKRSMGKDAEHKFYEVGWMRADSNFLDVFTFPLTSGDPATAIDDPTGMVISQSAALKHFGRLDVLGESMNVYSADTTIHFTITGVMEDVPYNSHFTFDFLSRINFPNLETRWSWYNYYTYIKLRDGVTIADVEPKLQPLFDQYQEAGSANALFQCYSQPLSDIHLRSHLKWELGANGNINNVYIFGALAVFVLLISSINYVNLTVGEGLKRFQEVGVRKVFGANRATLIGQFLVETFLILALALVLGVAAAEFLFGQLAGVLGREVSIFTNLPTLGLLSLAILLLGLGAGLYPALRVSGFKSALAVKGLVSASGKSALALRQPLLVVQFALSAFMIIGTLTVFRQLQHLKHTDKGIAMEQMLIIENADDLPNQTTTITEIKRLSQVKQAGASTGILGGINWTTSIGYPDPKLINYISADPEAIEALELEWITGRNFSRDIATDTSGFKLVMNETGLRELGFTLTDVGHSRPILQQDTAIIEATILGVVKDFHFTDMHSEIKPFAFVFDYDAKDFLYVKLSNADLASAVEAIQAVWQQYSDGNAMEYFFLEDTYAKHYAQEERLSDILLYITGLALFIACLGMFAVANMVIKDRRREIAIRKVLGATVSQVTGLVSKRFLLLVMIANLIAVPVAYLVVQRWLAGFAYQASSGFLLYGLAVLGTLVLAALTVGFQSLRAAINNPAPTLRAE
ncbi:MAG: ABC transporter permease [Bacteroidota bacterium]